MIPLLAPILKVLATNGLSMLAGAIQSKGKDIIEQKLEIKIPDNAEHMTPELLHQFKVKEMEHEEFLVNAQVKMSEMLIAADTSAGLEVTKRWEADMLSDSYMSKNIRPLSFAGMLISFLILAILSTINITVAPEYIDILKNLLTVMTSAYFVGRTVEKSIDIYKGWTETKGG